MFTQSKRNGVTLIEAVMVVVLLSASAVASSFVLRPRWSSERNVTGVIHHVADTLTMARNTSITNQADVRVQRIRKDGQAMLEITETAGPVRDEKVSFFELGPEVTVNGSPTEIRFSPMGTANRDLRWTITQGGVAGEVRVSPTTGSVQTRVP
ncbi:pilus assembly FimT family protein [Novipirellula sp. SH528]|uniref:pilus assembly FimT family protein n=1 Tax=Novipirellula sp. SH528 TaxID=3454466 RepID=UPI003FA0250E